jgi:hypothetical protein
MTGNRKAGGKVKTACPDRPLPAELARAGITSRAELVQALRRVMTACPDRPLPAELARAGFSPQAWALAQRVGAAFDLVKLCHLECGSHSGFAPCCVVFFTTLWLPSLFAGEHEELIEGYEVARMALGVGNVGYILCPACALAGKAVEPKRCPRRCPMRRLGRRRAEGEKLQRKLDQLLNAELVSLRRTAQRLPGAPGACARRAPYEARPWG